MSNNKVLATVGPREITESDFERASTGFDPQTAEQFKTPEGKKRLVQELVNQELFYLDAVEKKLDQDEEFKSQLEKFKTDLLKQYSIGMLLKDIKVTEDEVLSFYKQNEKQFKSDESVKASHILVETEEKAKNILSEIKSGLSFEDAARKYSSCPSNQQGGDLGYFTRGRMVPEFEDAAFALDKGQISEPVKTMYGYHLIKLTEKKQEQVKSYDEVKNQLAQQLLGQKQEHVYFNKIIELKQNYETKIME